MEPEVTPAQAAATEYRAQLDTIVDPGQKGPDTEASSSAAPAASTAAPEASGVSPQLIERAIRAGIPTDVAKQANLSFLERYVEQQERPDPEPPPVAQPQYKFDPFTGEPLQKTAPKIEFPDLPEIAEDETGGWHPALKKAWKDQQDAFRTKLEERDARLEKMEQALQSQEQTRAQQVNEQGFRTLEGLITKDKDFEHVFGEGPAHRHAGTHYIAARQEVAVMMDAIAQAKQKSGQHVPEPEALYGMAKAALYPELIGKKAETKAEGKLANRVRDAQGRLLHKPTATTRSDTYENMAPGPEKAKVGLEILMRNGKMD